MSEPIVTATLLLVAVTCLLVIVSGIGAIAAISEGRRRSRADDANRAVLDRQASALAASSAALDRTAVATKAMADEMLEARRTSNPLAVSVRLTDPGPGRIAVMVERETERGAIITHAALLLGRERRLVWEANYANQYLGGQRPGLGISQGLDIAGDGDLLILRITGTPEDGIEQSREFYFRILPTGVLEPLTDPAIPWMAS